MSKNVIIIMILIVTLFYFLLIKFNYKLNTVNSKNQDSKYQRIISSYYKKQERFYSTFIFIFILKRDQIIFAINTVDSK